MPEIELSKEQICNPRSLRPGIEISALMLFPKDKEKRDRFVLHLVMNLSRHSDILVPLTIGEIRAMLNAPGIKEIAKDVSYFARRGIVAGSLLRYVHAMASGKITEPSIKKAMFIYQSMYEKREIDIPLSEQTIRECWTEFKPVAHLHAAQFNNQLNPDLAEEDRPLVVFDTLSFLSTAGAYQEFGCNFIPKRARPAEPILDRSEIWRVPQWISNNASLEDTKPSQWLVETINKYRAPVKF